VIKSLVMMATSHPRQLASHLAVYRQVVMDRDDGPAVLATCKQADDSIRARRVQHRLSNDRACYHLTEWAGHLLSKAEALVWCDSGSTLRNADPTRRNRLNRKIATGGRIWLFRGVS